MPSNLDSIFLTVVTTITGIVLGWALKFLSDALQLRSTKRKDLSMKLQSTIEEVATVTYQLRKRNYAISSEVIGRILSGGRFVSEREGEILLQRLELLVDFYLPDFRPEFDQIQKALQAFTVVYLAASFISDLKDRQDIQLSIISTSEDFESKCKVFLEKLARRMKDERKKI